MASLDRTRTLRRPWGHSSWLRRLGPSYGLLMPFLLLFGLFVAWPILMSAYLSLTNYNALKAPEFIGLKNYTDLFGDKRFIKSMVNIIQYVMLVVPLNTILGLTLALAFHRQTWVNYFFRTLIFLPTVTSSISIMTIWGWIFSGREDRPANVILGWLGYERISFMTTPSAAIPVMVLLAICSGIGLTMIFFLAGLQAIPHTLLEAAAIDGAAPWQRFVFVTLPLLRPPFLYVTITSLINAFQVFDVSYLLFSGTGTVGGVLDSALTPVLYLYNLAFSRFRLGYASAIAWVLFTVILVLTIINLRTSQVHPQE